MKQGNWDAAMAGARSASRGERRLTPTATLLALIVAVGMFLALSTGALAEAGKGTVKGTITNDTAKGAAVADAEVTLTTYKDQGQTTAGTLTAKTDKDGNFTFTGLDTSADITYQASLDFHGAPYFSEPATFAADGADQTVKINVADTTTSADAVKSTSTHFLVDASQDGIAVSEIIILTNSGDRTYIGSKEIHPGTNETLRITLPAGAQDVQLFDGFAPARAFPVEGSISDTYPIYPGDSQRIFQFHIPVTGTSGSFTTKIDLPTDQVNVLLPDNGTQASISNLPDKANRDMQGQQYVVFSGKSLAAGTSLEFKLDSLPKAQPPAAPAAQGAPASAAAPAPAGAKALGNMPLIAGGALLVLLVALAAVTVVLRRRRAGRAEEPEDEEEVEEDAHDEGEGDDLEAEREELIAAIARLDDAYEQDKMGAEEYGRLRAQKKRRLVEIAGRQQTLAATRSRE